MIESDKINQILLLLINSFMDEGNSLLDVDWLSSNCMKFIHEQSTIDSYLSLKIRTVTVVIYDSEGKHAQINFMITK